MGGETPSRVNIIDYVTIASTGNATDFGDLLAATGQTAVTGNSVKAFSLGGSTGSDINTIQNIIINTTGNATDFADLALQIDQGTAISNAHGGLTDGYQGTRPGVFFDQGQRGLFGGRSGPGSTAIDFITISTTGDSTNFGNLTFATGASASGNETRSVFSQGYSAPSYLDVISYVTTATTGNASDFGDLTQARYFAGGASNSTRAVFGGGGANTSPVFSNVIDYVEISSLGNAADFGDLSVARKETGASNSTTRAIFGGGEGPGVAYSNVIDYITIASTGNATDFGDLTTARRYLSGTSSSTRGLFAGGTVAPAGEA